MSNAWSYYLLAFRNIFNYKNKAQRQELNWFILFTLLFWFILSFLFMGANITFAVIGKVFIVPILFAIGFIIAGLFFIIHTLPFIALIKRRFNSITPVKSGLFFLSWLCIWLMQLAVCFGILVFMLGHQQLENPLLILPIAFLGQLCGLIVVGTVIFLMVREKPII